MYNERCPPHSTQHVIKKGDTFWKLSQTYEIDLQSIMDANPGVDANNLQIGSTLCIPAAPAPSDSPHTCPESTLPYIVLSGDTLWKLAQRYKTSVDEILDLNPGVDPQNLQIGSTLCLPSPPMPPTPQTPPVRPTQPMPPTPPTPSARSAACPKGSFPYTVQQGDTLWTLSRAFGISVQRIFDLNPGINPQAGSILCLPYPLTPPASPTPESSPRYFAYSVKKCDSICGIARKFCVSVESILRRNPGISPRCLQAGTTISVPMNCCGGNVYRYSVRPGDTLYSIANRFNICPLALVAANPYIDFNHLVRCQIICIPNV